MNSISTVKKFKQDSENTILSSNDSDSWQHDKFVKTLFRK